MILMCYMHSINSSMIKSYKPFYIDKKFKNKIYHKPLSKPYIMKCIELSSSIIMENFDRIALALTSTSCIHN